MITILATLNFFSILLRTTMVLLILYHKRLLRTYESSLDHLRDSRLKLRSKLSFNSKFLDLSHNIINSDPIC